MNKLQRIFKKNPILSIILVVCIVIILKKYVFPRVELFDSLPSPTYALQPITRYPDWSANE